MIVAVTDRKSSLHPILQQVELVAKGHPDMLVVRDKDMCSDDFREFARRCRDICMSEDVEICINSRYDIAKELDVRTVQMPMDILLMHAEDLAGLSVGASVHSIDDVRNAESCSADRLVFGNVFDTSCKPGKPGTGIDMLREVCDSTELPVYAIGGVTADNAGTVFDAGSAGICCMSYLMGADDPSERIERLRNIEISHCK